MPPASSGGEVVPPPLRPLKSSKSISKTRQILTTFSCVLAPLGPLLASLLGLLWGLSGAQVASTSLPKASWTPSWLQNASLQNYHVLLCETTLFGLLGLPKTRQERPEKGPRSIQDGIFSFIKFGSISGPFLADLGSLLGPQEAPKSAPRGPQEGPKIDEKMIKF